MKRHGRPAKGRLLRLRVWTYAEACAALPYIRSIVQSLREARLEAVRQHLAARRLASRPGRPDRAALMASDDALREARRADERVREVQDELRQLDVYCLNPVSGLALIPFVHGDQLAWFVFDLFDSQPLRFWRYQSDPLEKRRPIAEIEPLLDGSTLVV